MRVEDRASEGRWHLLILWVLPQPLLWCCVVWGTLVPASCTVSFECVQKKEGVMKCPENLSQNKGKLAGALITRNMHRGEETDVPQDQVAGRCR